MKTNGGEMRGNSPEVVVEERSRSFRIKFLNYCSIISTFMTQEVRKIGLTKWATKLIKTSFWRAMPLSASLHHDNNGLIQYQSSIVKKPPKSCIKC